MGLTAAIELARRGVSCRIIDPLPEPPMYAKAVGVQPRRLEVFEAMGVLRPILDAGTEMRGQIVYVDGEQVQRMDLSLPGDVPFGFHLIPQYATEQILAAELRRRGVEVHRGVRLTAFDQDDDGVTVLPLLRDAEGDFGRNYSMAGTSTFVVRPDGYLSYACHGVGITPLLAHLSRTFR